MESFGHVSLHKACEPSLARDASADPQVRHSRVSLAPSAILRRRVPVLSNADAKSKVFLLRGRGLVIKR